MLEERGVFVAHTSIFRWVIRLTPQLEAEFRKRKAPVGVRWRLEETYVKVKGQHRYLYRAVDKGGNRMDFLLTARRDPAAALRFLEKAIGQNGLPELINIDKSGANTAGIEDYNDEHEGVEIEIRHCKYLNNIVEQDHRNINRRTGPMLGLKAFRTARIVLGGIELVHMLGKGQLASAPRRCSASAAESFYQLAA